MKFVFRQMCSDFVHLLRNTWIKMFSKGSFIAFCLLKHLGLLLPGGRWFSFLALTFNLALPFRHCFCLCTVWKEFVTPVSVISQTGSLVTSSPKAWGSTAVLLLFFAHYQKWNKECIKVICINALMFPPLQEDLLTWPNERALPLPWRCPGASDLGFTGQ